MKRIRTIKWSQKDSDEPPMYYDLNSEADAKQFFKNVNDNAERDGREVFELEDVTEEEWNSFSVAGLALSEGWTEEYKEAFERGLAHRKTETKKTKTEKAGAENE